MRPKPTFWRRLRFPGCIDADVTRRFVLATANPDKAAEVRMILEEALGHIELLPRPDDLPEVNETGETLEENARLKAQALVKVTGIAAVADDTGLEVDAI